MHKYIIINLFPRPLQIGKQQPGNEVVSLRDREFMYHAYVPLQEA